MKLHLQLFACLFSSSCVLVAGSNSSTAGTVAAVLGVMVLVCAIGTIALTYKWVKFSFLQRRDVAVSLNVFGILQRYYIKKGKMKITAVTYCTFFPLGGSSSIVLWQKTQATVEVALQLHQCHCCCGICWVDNHLERAVHCCREEWCDRQHNHHLTKF